MSDNGEHDRWADLDDPEAVARAAARLEQFNHCPSEVAARRRIVDLLNCKPGESIVDVGAGTGDLMLDIAKRVAPGGHVTGLDLSRGLLELAEDKARASGLSDFISTRTGDARTLGFDDDAFDAALSHWVLLHIPKPEEALAEMMRVVRPGGRVLCVEMDWETMTVHPGDRELTRRVVRANVERQVDGQTGRKLGPMMTRLGLNDVRVEPIVDVDSGGANDGWYQFLESRVPVAVDRGVDAGKAEAWWREIESAAARDQYFFSVVQFAVNGFVPGSSDNSR